MHHHFIKTVHCSGGPYEIGFTHGSSVSAEVHSNIETYTSFFNETAQITWEQARERAAADFAPTLEIKYPEILEEMRGIAVAAGGGLTRDDILTLNVRSEIALTNYADGCTSISQTTNQGKMFLAQNWDWVEELQKGMVLLDIKPTGTDTSIKFLSEAGIVGKIGMNSAGFGLCSNAIRSGSLDKSKFPVHIMSRRLLQYATSLESAVAIIEKFGVASTMNYMLADQSGKHVDLKCSPHGNLPIQPADGYVTHTNHLYAPNRPPKLIDHPASNSMTRLARIQKLTEKDKEMQVPTTFESLRARLSDNIAKSVTMSPTDQEKRT